MRALAFIFALSACVPIVIPVPVATTTQVRNLPTDRAPDASFDAQLNAARGTTIVHNATLAAVAAAHAADMETRGYFAHQSPDGTRARDRAAAQGVPACGVGENIAQGQTSSAEVFAGWMASGQHRKNMLNPKMASYGLGRAGDTWVLMLYRPC